VRPFTNRRTKTRRRRKSPIGRQIRCGKDWLSIVDVCGNIKHAKLDADSDMEIYAPSPQIPEDVTNSSGVT
jgi:hypothetical protein